MQVGKKSDKTDKRVRMDEQELKDILLDMFAQKNEISFEDLE